jgi:hypothetical protein
LFSKNYEEPGLIIERGEKRKEKELAPMEINRFKDIGGPIGAFQDFKLTMIFCEATSAQGAAS